MMYDIQQERLHIQDELCARKNDVWGLESSYGDQGYGKLVLFKTY